MYVRRFFQCAHHAVRVIMQIVNPGPPPLSMRHADDE